MTRDEIVAWCEEASKRPVGSQPLSEKQRERYTKLRLPPKCEGCGVYRADPPSRLCPGCQAYEEHQQ